VSDPGGLASIVAGARANAPKIASCFRLTEVLHTLRIDLRLDTSSKHGHMKSRIHITLFSLLTLSISFLTLTLRGQVPGALSGASAESSNSATTPGGNATTPTTASAIAPPLEQALRSFKWSCDNFVRGMRPWGTLTFDVDEREFFSMNTRGGWNPAGPRQIMLGNGVMLTFDEKFGGFEAVDSKGVKQFTGKRMPSKPVEPAVANSTPITPQATPGVLPPSKGTRPTTPAPTVAGLAKQQPINSNSISRQPPVGVPGDAQFFGGKWYRLYSESLSWQDARQRCDRLGGQLAVVPDSATWDFVKPLTKDAWCWLGATDEQSPTNWKWIDGTPVGFSAWANGQPDSAGSENYLHTGLSGGWNDAPKHGRIGSRRVVGFVCEWKDR
jgi:Lectin C-type domain